MNFSFRNVANEMTNFILLSVYRPTVLTALLANVSIASARPYREVRATTYTFQLGLPLVHLQQRQNM